MKRFDKVTNIAKKLGEQPGAIETTKDDYGHEDEEIVMAIYGAEEEEPERHSEAGPGGRPVKKAVKKPVRI